VIVAIIGAVPAIMEANKPNATVDNRQPHAACGSTMYGFVEIDPNVMFWKDVDQFEVVRNNT
jgi:hypothetical protein